jgi:Cellulose binding domain.
MNSWSSGYQINVDVENGSSSAISSWTLELDFGEDPQVTGSWNVNVSESGNVVTASNISWNGNVGAGQTTSFGMQGSSDGNLSTPTCSVL